MGAMFLQICQFVLLLALAVAVIEAYLYVHFTFYDRDWFMPATILGAPFAAFAAAVVAMGPAFDPGKGAAFAAAATLVQAAASYFFKYVARGKHSVPFMLLTPGLLGLMLLIAYPLAFEVYLAFHDLKLTTIMAWSRTGELPFVGIKQFVKVFTSSPLSKVTFLELLMRTVWWTFINVSLHILGGFALALLLNRITRFKGVYRMLLIIPWAMPQVVAVLAMRGEFHSQYGFVNIMIERLAAWLPFLKVLGLAPVQWLTHHPFLTCTIINVWLGIPFMMVIILGGLQSISRHYYDAAAIDGASPFQQFRHITLPMIRPILAPAVTLGTIWTFNNINVIYLVTGQAGGAEDADILVSALYKAAFTYYRYSYSAAFAIVIFIILFSFSIFWLKYSKGAESVHG